MLNKILFKPMISSKGELEIDVLKLNFFFVLTKWHGTYLIAVNVIHRRYYLMERRYAKKKKKKKKKKTDSEPFFLYSLKGKNKETENTLGKLSLVDDHTVTSMSNDI